MKISVIIPIYKVEKYLRQCVDSVLNQSYRNLEIILVDDGSPDGCPQICDEYANKDERVIVVHKNNGGLSDARNKGIEIASGEYGMFLDSDDYWDSFEAISRLVDRLSKTNPDVLNFGYYKLYEDTGKKVIFAESEPSLPLYIHGMKERLEYLSKHNLVVASACNKLVRMETLKQIPFECGKLSEDIEWTAKLICMDLVVDYIAEPFYCYRQRGGSISQSISSVSCENLASAIIKCCTIAQNSSDVSRSCINSYTAYQFSTFFAVQALTESFQKKIIVKLNAYKEILRYHGNNKKVKCMYYGTRIFGMLLWCYILRVTKGIWNNRRDRI